MDIFKKHEKIKITFQVKLVRVVHIPTSSHKRELQLSWKRCASLRASPLRRRALMSDFGCSGSKKDNRGETKKFADAVDLELGDTFKVTQSMKQVRRAVCVGLLTVRCAGTEDCQV